MINRLIALPLAILGAMVFASSADAQGHATFAGHQVRTNSVRPRHSHRFFDGSGYAPYFYSDYDSEPGSSEGPSPQNFEPAVQPVPPSPASSPGLVLEFQGDNWVRLTNYGESQTGNQSVQPTAEPASNPVPSTPAGSPRRTQATTQATQPPASVLPSAVLVFRDRHKEEIEKYLIVGATLYASSDYWTSGSWTRKVPIAALDVPATLKLNQDRGANFTLPSRPNEVMMRP
jgi:hypothetical protein